MNYQRIYDSLINRAKERELEGYVERHHVVPRCIGGSDDEENIVSLTPEEHFVAHILLVKIHPEHPKLIFAANMMGLNSNGKRPNNRKIYGWLRRRFLEVLKSDPSFRKNLGKKIISNEELQISMFISKDDEIPEGFKYGVLEKRRIQNGNNVRK
jgi:hypothetical protein